MRVGLACDHGGYKLKEEVKAILQDLQIDFEDCGIYNEHSVDYPPIAQKLCEEVLQGTYQRGILVCGTGIGVSIVANRIPGIRAALCSDVFSAVMSREHNDANVLCLGGRVVGPGLAGMLVKSWLETEFAGGRHAQRIGMIDK